MNMDINEDLISLRMSVMYLEKDFLEEADDLFQPAHNIIYEELSKKDKGHFLKSLWLWCKTINSEQAREIVKNTKINKLNPTELHYYILTQRKKIMYPLLLLTYFITLEF